MVKTKVFAAYLPQYHITEDNNRFWGEGFTDWVGVKNAKPLFAGHKQPRVPLDLNYYDLSDVNVIRSQAKMAREYGIEGFNIYHYWFKDGKQELEKPAELLLETPDIDIAYFFSWDNCPWSRTWGNIKGNDWAPLYEGMNEKRDESGVLVPFEYGGETEWKKHFDYLLPFFKDGRYYKIDNRPVFFFCTRHEPETLFKMGMFWDKCAKEAGFEGLFLVNKKRNFFTKPIFDMEFGFEPEASAWGKRRTVEIKLNDWFHICMKHAGEVKYNYSYDKVWKRIIRSAKQNKKEIPGSIVRYDDTPRRGKDAMIISGETPGKFKDYFSKLYELCCKNDKPFMLLTAWNEWGEGAYLEPDEESGYAYLEALKEAMGK